MTIPFEVDTNFLNTHTESMLGDLSMNGAFARADPSPALRDQTYITYEDNTDVLPNSLPIPSLFTPTLGKLLRGDGDTWEKTTASFADTYAINTLLYAPSDNNVSGLANQVNSTLVTNSSGAIGWLSLGLGRVLMGAGSSPVAALILPGDGLDVDVDTGTATITISLTPPSSYFNHVTTSTQALAVNNTYYTTYAGLCTMTLPATAAVGSVIKVYAGPSGNTFKIAQNASQYIYYGAQGGAVLVSETGTGGYIQSTNPATTVKLVCVVENVGWMVTSNVTNLQVNV